MTKSTGLFVLVLLISLWASAQKHPLSRSDSGIVVANLQKYDDLIARDDFRGASGALNDVAFVYWNNNHYEEAAKYYEQSLDLNMRVANENGIAMINNNLGMLYADLGRYEQSLDKFSKTLAARRASNEEVGIIAALVNMAVVLNNLERYEESVKRLSEALDLAREHYDKQQMRSVYGMLSETYEKMGDVERSLQYFELYKSFHEQIQREEIKGVNEQLEKERVQKQQLAAEKALKENELLKKQLELYQKNEELQQKDSINQSLYSSLSAQELELELLERDKQLSDLEAEAQHIENQKLEVQKNAYLTTLIIVVIAGVIIAILILINVRKTKQHNQVLEEKNRSIEEQRQELEVANHTKDRIFSVISHDLRSPISSLRGFFSYIDLFDVPDELRNALKGVESQLANSATLLENLLTWSRSQLEKAVPKKEEVAVAEIVEKNFRLLQEHATKKEIALSSSITNNDVLFSDPDTVDIVLRNLIQNALKFTPKGGSVAISYNHSPEEDCVIVKDTGVGMKPEKVASLFDISTNRSSVGTDKEKGSGLGLILCKELIEKVGGVIEVSSEPEVGTEFKLRFQN
ncbi:ATP-binding protein [Marinoscillum furvescens]|uniref:histidine kinase n=1 Tax=Marinoscillum furvescens DSM 4134 TaxID=1122208 RepID=A0A3D9LJ35_MARFU|nr:ATP-binding protein [Marinoscillum furvescens]REE05885.1 signal transduction histidine kinase [Marinoscillum furvescens DSM 4134]